MAAAATLQAEAFARLAVEETGYGVVADKVQKNLFSSVQVYEFIRPMRTVGVVARHEHAAALVSIRPLSVEPGYFLIPDLSSFAIRPWASMHRVVRAGRMRSRPTATGLKSM